MSELSDFAIGQSVELPDGRPATVQYTGTTHFAAGDWIGIELDDATGKNDGEVQGQRYFSCGPKHGMFVRPSAVTILEQPTPKAKVSATARANGTGAASRPSSMLVGGAARRQSTLGAGTSKRQSINGASPTPGPRASRLTSPSKSPTKQFGSITSTAPSNTARKAMPPPASSKRSSMGPPSSTLASSRATSTSIAGRMNGISSRQSSIASGGQGSGSRLSMRSGMSRRLDSMSEDGQVSVSSGPRSPGFPDLGQLSPAPEASNNTDDRVTSPKSSDMFVKPEVPEHVPKTTMKPVQPAAQRTATNAASQREIDDLKTKLRLVEKKRLDDREKLKSMEKLQTDRDRFEGIIQKLQAKYQPQQQELLDLKKRVGQEDERRQVLEAQIAENDSIQEMATLDREMAEETAEAAMQELNNLRQKYEELELEVTVLREENEELGKEISPEDKTSQGWLQLERSNARLREALIRLRDVTQEKEMELSEQIGELEEDVKGLEKTQVDYDQLKINIEESNAMVEDLRQQLDTALGAEEMIEELGEKNMSLSERIEEMKVVIEDLESLKELNDELEFNHTETEKQLQAEIDYTESLLSEEAGRAAHQDGTIQDLEYTVTRFRELVSNMQSDLEDMRASQQITETEANELSNRSRAMMDLNMRLQTSAAKTQVKAIDLELGKLQAQESLEHLSIVQLYLPSSFRDEQLSVQALLRFRRIAYKANMVHSFVKERMTSRTSMQAQDELIASSSVLDKLVWISSTCDRFINSIHTSNLDEYKRIGAASHELEPVERVFGVFIDGLKRDDIKMGQWADDLQRTTALMTHLAEIHISDSLQHFPNQALSMSQVMQSNLENASTILAQMKSRIEAQEPVPESEEDAEQFENLGIFTKIDNLISQSRSARVVTNKSIRQLEDLKSRSLSLEPAASLDTITQSSVATADFAVAVRDFGSSVLAAMSDDTDSADSMRARFLESLTSGSTSLSCLASKLQQVMAGLQNLSNMTNSLVHTVEFPSPPPPPPWKLLAQKLRDETEDSSAREAVLGRLKEEVSEKRTVIVIKDKVVEELSVKVEVLEKRIGESGGRRERIRELEQMAEAAKSKDKDYVVKMSRLRDEIEKLEAEREHWKANPRVSEADSSADPLTGRDSDTRPSASALRQISTLTAQIKSLEGTIRYLRLSLHNNVTLPASLAYLSTPLIEPTPPPSIRQQNLETESKAVLKELIHLVTAPESAPLRLPTLRSREDRGKWRPARETSNWQIQRQREEWAGWKDWMNSVARRSEIKSRPIGQTVVDTIQNGKLPAQQSKGGDAGNVVRIVGVDHDVPVSDSI